ncbi:MAG: FtsH protease activity modulator HflK, partial [Pseudomonadota bacterium]
PWGGPRPNGGGGGGRRPGGEPPDLEDLLQASRQRLKRAFPRSGGGGRGGRGGPEINAKTIGFATAGLAFLWGLSGFYQVQANQLGVVTTFGEYSAITSPGLHWHIPAPVQNAQLVNVTDINTAPIPANRQAGAAEGGLMLTGDKNIVDVEMVVQWKVKAEAAAEDGAFPGPAKFVFNIDDPLNLVTTVGEAAIREVVGSNSLDYVQTTGRTDVQIKTQELMQATLDLQGSGMEITSVNLQKTEPPTQEVNEAFLDVEAAKQDREQFINNARTYQNQVVPEARGQAQRVLEDARGYQARVTAEARGQADRFNAIASEYQKAPEVTRQRMYLETVEKVLGDMNKIIVEDDAGSGVVPYLPLNELSKRGDQ